MRYSIAFLLSILSATAVAQNTKLGEIAAQEQRIAQERNTQYDAEREREIKKAFAEKYGFDRSASDQQSILLATPPKRFRIVAGSQELKIGDTPIQIEEITEPTPEPLPDRDGDGFPDANDICPDDPTNKCNDVPPPEPQPTASKLLTPERLEGLKQLFATNHPDAISVLRLANNDGGYNQQGEWATLVYLGTGDKAYASRAFDQFRRRWIDPAKLPEARSDTREFLVTIAQHYEWCEPGLTTEQATEWRRILMMYAELCLGMRPETGWGTRINDDDEVWGHYFGIVKIAQVIAAKEPDKSETYLSHPLLAQMREAIKRFCILARGGEGTTAAGYNSGTNKVAMIGLFATGPENFPEVLEYLKQAAVQLQWDMLPDLSGTIKFGDTFADNKFPNTGYIAEAAMFAGLLGNKNDRALYEILSKQQPWWIELYRVLWVIDVTNIPTEPYVAPTGFRSSPGVGLHICRGTNFLFECLTPQEMTVGPNNERLDHTGFHVTDFQLWWDGERVITHPIGYQQGQGAYNTVLFGGLSREFGPPGEVMTIESAEKTPTGCKIVWRFKTVEAPYGIPPFVDDFTRTIEFTAPNKVSVVDHFNGHAPDLVNDPYWSSPWRVWLADVVRKSPALWQSLYHTPVTPAPLATGYTWRTTGGHDVTLTTGARNIVIKTTLENASPIGGGGAYDPAQLVGSQVRLLSDDNTADLSATIEAK